MLKSQKDKGHIISISGLDLTINGKKRILTLQYHNGKWYEI